MGWRQYIAQQLQSNPDVQSPVLDDPVIQTLARAHGKEAAQVVLRWAVQHGLGVIVKSGSEQRIASNMDIFDYELFAEELYIYIYIYTWGRAFCSDIRGVVQGSHSYRTRSKSIC